MFFSHVILFLPYLGPAAGSQIKEVIWKITQHKKVIAFNLSSSLSHNSAHSHECCCWQKMKGSNRSRSKWKYRTAATQIGRKCTRTIPYIFTAWHFIWSSVISLIFFLFKFFSSLENVSIRTLSTQSHRAIHKAVSPYWICCCPIYISNHPFFSLSSAKGSYILVFLLSSPDCL